MDKKDLFQIGEVAKLFHVSVGTVRHYEKMGLIEPEFVDGKTGYRYYSTRQFERLNTIRYLRALGTPLDEIGKFFENKNIDSIKSVLENQKREVLRKRRELEIVEKKIDNRLLQIENAINSKPDVIEIEETPPMRIAWIRKSLSVKNHLDIEMPIRELEKEQNRAMVFLGKVGLSISEEHLKKGEFETYDRVFLVLDDEDSYMGTVEKIEKTQSVTLRYCGSHNEAAGQYAKMTKFIEENGLEIAGFSSEITMIDYAYTNDTDKFVTEIRIPVKTLKTTEG